MNGNGFCTLDFLHNLHVVVPCNYLQRYRVTCELEIVHYYSNLCSLSIVLCLRCSTRFAIHQIRAILVRTIILLNCATLRERIVRCLPFDAFTLLPQVVEEIEESKI